MEVVLDYDDVDVDDQSMPSIHVDTKPVFPMGRMFERDDWRDDFPDPA